MAFIGKTKTGTTAEDLLEALKGVKDPDLNQDIVTLGFVKEARVEGDKAVCTIELTTPACPVKDQLRDQARVLLEALPGIRTADVQMTAKTRSGAGPAREKLLPRVKNIIAVASGKGGVGKSTVSANLALALAAKGAKTGLLDADVYGPSIPTILGITERPTALGEGRIAPVDRYGVKVISTGFFIPTNEAVIWRGPMLHKMIQDFLGVVEWGELDYLIIDLPPGTGDVQLSLCQTIPLTGAVIVSTPQDVAWNVAQKAILMFDKLNAPILGILENMSHFACTHCGGREEIFGNGGARPAAGILGIPFLGEVPLVTDIRRTADSGDPVVHSAPGSPSALNFTKIAENLAAQVSIRNIRGDSKPVPAKIGPPNEAEFSIEWSDGKRSTYPVKLLRGACPCAACVDEITGQRRVGPESVRDDVRVRAVSPVGRYALQILWSDGHDTGLYGYTYLRDLVGCP